MRIALVISRYGLEVNGGAELHCRWIAEHLARYYDVSVITTCAISYVDWRDHYPPGPQVVNGIPVHRFGVVEPRDPDRFYEASQEILYRPHSEADELRWLDLQGPNCPELISFIQTQSNDFDLFIFFTYLYSTTFYGLTAVSEKRLLVPTAHDELPMRLGIFRKLFSLPRFIIYNTATERDFVHRLTGNAHIPSAVVGTGIDRPTGVDVESFREKNDLRGAYIIYVGRIDEMKGCHELLDYFVRFRKEESSDIGLVLVGRAEKELPQVDGVVSLGFLPEEGKAAAIQGASVVVVPSRYESLSMITLEAWLAGKPVLANGRCHVLRDMCIRGNGGLFYTDYEEFKESLRLLLGSAELREKLGSSGRRFVEANYDWSIVENKYLEIIEGLR